MMASPDAAGPGGSPTRPGGEPGDAACAAVVGSPRHTHKLVLPEHLNHHGFLFGGHLLKWVDEVAWIAARLDHPGREFVTMAMADVEFRHKVGLGTILTLNSVKLGQGTTSVRYRVEVQGDVAPDRVVFATLVTLVHVDANGRKRALAQPPEGGESVNQ